MLAPLTPGSSNADRYLRLRVVIGIIIGLSIAELLGGVAQLVQHPEVRQISFIGLGFFDTLSMICFWQWEFDLV